MAPPAIGTDPWHCSHPSSFLDAAKLTGVSSIQTDHDYVISSGSLDNGQAPMSPAFKVDILSLDDDDDDVDDEMINVDVSDDGVSEKGVDDLDVVDAMLPAARTDVSSSSGEADHMDFLQELDDLDFDLNDLDPCSDFSMDESFEDFLDDTLDKPFCPYTIDDFFRDDPTSNVQVQGHGDVTKEAFMSQLGLIPTSRQISKSDVDSLINNCVDRDSQSFFRTNSVQVPSIEASLDPEETHLSPPSNSSNSSSPLASPRDGVFHFVPTKTCSNSDADSSMKSVYSTAKASSTDHVRTCASTTLRETTNAGFPSLASYIGQRLELSGNLPSDIFRPGDELVPLSSAPSDSGEFLQWLMAEDVSTEGSKKSSVVTDSREQSPASCHISAETPSVSRTVPAFTDHECYIDLEDYVKDSEESIKQDSGLVQNEAQAPLPPLNDHTYHQPSVEFPKSKTDKTSQLQLSILSHPKTREEIIFDGDQDMSETSFSDFRTSTTSPTMFRQTDDFPLSPYDLKSSPYSDNQLDLLRIFSDEAASALLFSDAIASDLRLI